MIQRKKIYYNNKLADTVDQEPIQSTLIEYFNSHNPEMKNDIVKYYQPLFDRIGLIYHNRLFRNTSIPLDENDASILASMGFSKALPYYNPQLGTKLSSFAYTKMRGTILDEVISLTKGLSPLEKRINAIQETQIEFKKNRNRNPTIEELAELLKLKPTDIESCIYREKIIRIISFSEIAENKHKEILKMNSSLSKNMQPIDVLINNDYLRIFKKAIKSLPGPIKKTFDLHYIQGLTYQEISNQIVELTKDAVAKRIQENRESVRIKLRNLLDKDTIENIECKPLTRKYKKKLYQ